MDSYSKWKNMATHTYWNILNQIDPKGSKLHCLSWSKWNLDYRYANAEVRVINLWNNTQTPHPHRSGRSTSCHHCPQLTQVGEAPELLMPCNCWLYRILGLVKDMQWVGSPFLPLLPAQYLCMFHAGLLEQVLEGENVYSCHCHKTILAPHEAAPYNWRP